MIRIATIDDLDNVEGIYNAILDYEEKNMCYTNWKRGIYPTRQTAIDAIKKGTLHIAENSEGVYGTLILNNEELEEYKNIGWSIEGEGKEILVIHTLCINPAFNGKGKGVELVEYAQEYGKTRGCKVIRLDTYEENILACRMYEKLGYTYAGKTLFNFHGIIENLKCYEKKI